MEEDDDEDAKESSVEPLVPRGHQDNVVSVSFKPLLSLLILPSAVDEVLGFAMGREGCDQKLL